jgi:hypothetical protein
MKPSQVIPGFARHETFQPRFGWFKKGFDETGASNGTIFNDDRATVALGVGKNMVRSIRFWCLAAKILRTARDPETNRLGLAIQTIFGDALLQPNGWDPYLEEVGSIWLLHWALLRPPCLAPVWWVAFNEFDHLEFEEGDLLDATIRRAGLVPGWPAPHSASVKKDVDCLIRMFSHSDPVKSVEDGSECPFRLLRLMEPVKGIVRSYRFMRGPKATLPAEVIAFAALDYMHQEASASTISLTALASVPGGPGRVFKISDDDIATALDTVASRTRSISVQSPAGTRQLVVREAPGKLAWAVLRKYYGDGERSNRPGSSKIDSLFGDVERTASEHLVQV